MTDSKFQQQKSRATNNGRPIEVKFRGHTYRIPCQEKWTIDTLEYFDEANTQPTAIVKAVRALMGEGPYKAFKDRHNTVGALNEFMQQLMETFQDTQDDSPNS